MKLFHGSNLKITKPRIIVSARTLDFGTGFYTTSDFEQASRWANTQTKRRREGQPTVSTFEFNEESVEALKVLRFESASKEWLEFVSRNRKGEYSGEKYDIIIGPVANDSTMPVISDFMSGVITEETALILLAPQRLKDQYAFLTYKGLEAITFKEVN